MSFSDDELAQLFERCSNRGRWGNDDEKGTLNYITAEHRVRAAQLIKEGLSVSLGKDLRPQSSSGSAPRVVHYMLYEQIEAISALDFVGIAPHGFDVTHMDALGHVYWEGRAYNGRNSTDICQPTGLSHASVWAMRDGIFTRGVLLDVADSRGVPWLESDAFVDPADLEAAERKQGIRVGEGDAVFVRIGLGAREAKQGPEDPTRRAGLSAECLPWLHERKVAVYSGDCVERTPYPSAHVPLPLHQIGLAAMGLVLVDCPEIEELTQLCTRLNRYDFALVVAPLRIINGTGSAVNPLAVF